MAEQDRSMSLVIISAPESATESLSTLLTGLPADFRAAIVVARRGEPAQLLLLEEALRQRTVLSVHAVTAQAKLAPGSVLIVPVQPNARILDGEVRVDTDEGERSVPEANLLYSAAHDYGERLIAVVLFDSGPDGAACARVARQAGGTVIVQKPTAAGNPGVPRSFALSAADIVTDLDGIARSLEDLVTETYRPRQSEDARVLHALLEQLRERSGIDFASYSVTTVQARLQRRMVATRLDRLADYIGYLQTDSDEYQRLIQSFLTKDTGFFRDPELFEYLRAEILPELINEAAARGNELRLWSAGCATGEEAYALAILVREALGDELTRFHVRVFATDVDSDAIAFARHGIYDATALAHVSPDRVSRYFTEIEGSYYVRKSLRSLIIFGQHDLSLRAPFPHIDLALCRNVIGSFTGDLQRRVLQLLAFSLRDRGFLVLGKTESVTQLATAFSPVSQQLKVYRRTGSRHLIPAPRAGIPTSPGSGRVYPGGRTLAGSEISRMARDVPSAAPGSIERLARLLLNLPVGVVVVDRHYDIQSINTTARQLLAIHKPGIGEDLIHLAQSIAHIPLRTAIDQVFQNGTPVQVQDAVSIELPNGQPMYLQVACYAQHADTNGRVDSVVVLVQDVTSMVEGRRTLERTEAAQREELERQAAIVQRLTSENRMLREANQELTASYTELRSMQEEFMVGNEEVQAATEEVETLNEELQATNEELETLNEELQATVEELNTTNEDLQVRSFELQELAVRLEEQRSNTEAERARLAAALQDLQDAVLVVDGSGRIVLANAVYQQTFAGQVSRFRLETADGILLAPDELPWQRVARGEAFYLRLAATSQDGARRWFDVTGQPVRGDGAAQGGVVVFRERAGGEVGVKRQYHSTE